MPLFVGIATLFITVFVVLYIWGVYDALWGGEDPTTPPEAVEVIAAEISNVRKDRGVLYDLGSCRGSFALQLARHLPELKIIGIDDSLFRVLLSRFRAVFFRNRPTFLYGNLFDLDIRDADFVHLYLPPEMLPAVQKKISSGSPEATTILYKLRFSDTAPTKILPVDSLGQSVAVYAHTSVRDG